MSNDMYFVVPLKPDKDKRYKFLVFNQDKQEYKRVKFGYKDPRTGKFGSTYIDHKDPQKKKAYLARHSALNEDWTDPFTAGFWSRWYLWSEPTIGEAEDLMEKKFNIQFL